MKITDKMRLDWIEAKSVTLNDETHRSVWSIAWGFGIPQSITRASTARLAIDAAIRAGRNKT